MQKPAPSGAGLDVIVKHSELMFEVSQIQRAVEDGGVGKIGDEGQPTRSSAVGVKIKSAVIAVIDELRIGADRGDRVGIGKLPGVEAFTKAKVRKVEEEIVLVFDKAVDDIVAQTILYHCRGRAVIHSEGIEAAIAADSSAFKGRVDGTAAIESVVACAAIGRAATSVLQPVIIGAADHVFDAREGVAKRAAADLVAGEIDFHRRR